MTWHDRLHRILAETCVMLRKGEVVQTSSPVPGLEVVTVDAMPHESDPEYAGLALVDLVLVTIGVNKARAEARRADLIDLLRTYPDPTELAGGPSYLSLGATVGDQGAALQLIALGKVLGIWHAVTPMTLKLADPHRPEVARDLAGGGAIWCSGFRP